MTDYIISEKELDYVNKRLNSQGYDNAGVCPLSEALKAEREKVLDELVTYCNDDENITYFDYPNGGWSDDMINQKWLLKKIESLRSEP